MNHIKTFEQLNEGERHDGGVHAAEMFLEEFITSLSEDDDYGSMSYTTESTPREGEYILDNQKADRNKSGNDSLEVWAEFAPTERTFDSLEMELSHGYEDNDLVKKFTKAVHDHNNWWIPEILSNNDDKTITLMLKNVSEEK